MNPAPIPQPSAQTCPNCGAAINGKPKFCPHCGAELPTSRPLHGCFFNLIQTILALMMICCGLYGSCLVMIGASSGRDEIGIGIGRFSNVLWGGFWVIIAGFSLWGLIRLTKKKR